MEMERSGIHQEILSRGSVFRLWIRRHGVGLAGLGILAGGPGWLSGIRGFHHLSILYRSSHRDADAGPA